MIHDDDDDDDVEDDVNVGGWCYVTICKLSYTITLRILSTMR